MSRPNLSRLTILGLCLASIPLAVGCLESRFPLGPRQPGKVDLRYIGDWILEARNDQGQTETSRLIIRNLHNDEYYLEWIAGDDKPFRCTGYIADISGESFANLQPLTDDGKIADKFFILRLDWDGEKFHVTNLNNEFFKTKQFDSSDELRKIVEQNVGNDEMYRGEPMVATREGR